MSLQLDSMGCHALFSDDRVYRYALWRTWDPSKGGVMFVGLNPSTADETEDDPTIRRCIRFARDWGYGGLTMANVFAFRATEPADVPMWGRDDDAQALAKAIGPENDAQLRSLAQTSALVVAAWGAHLHSFPNRERAVLDILGPEVTYLELTAQGHPRHPLYLPATAKPQPFSGTERP